MWSRIAEEMAIPWRAAEAMHWQMGETEMARRAGVTPFTLAINNINVDPHPPPPRPLARSNSSHSHSHSHGHGISPRLRRNSGPDGGPPQLPSLAELTAGIPSFALPPEGYASQPTTPYEFPTRRSLPSQSLYQHPRASPDFQPNGRRFP
jgi:hypothetical protein